MIDVHGQFEWGNKDPGPPERMQWGLGATTMTCITHHSLEGLYTPFGYSAFRDPNRIPTAWHGTVKRNGDLWQHYPVFVRLQHGNSANTLGPGFEAEGFAGEPLTAAQVATYRRIQADIAAYAGKTYARVPGSQVGLVEHREMTVPPGGTACPSDRYAPLWEALEGEDDMTKGEVETIVREVLEVFGLVGPGVPTLARLDDFVTEAFAAVQPTRSMAAIRKALHPDGPQ